MKEIRCTCTSFWKNHNSILRKKHSLSCKTRDCWLVEISLQWFLEVAKSSRRQQEAWQDKVWDNGWVVVEKNGWKQSNSNKICKTNQWVAKVAKSVQNFSVIMLKNFHYRLFVAVSGNQGGKVPVLDDVLLYHEREISLTISLDENCIEFEFEKYRNYYADLRKLYLTLNLKLVKLCGNETYSQKNSKRSITKR